jgi:2-polyprenyl-6-methoxyphenol hydroxylase-like FAD-dependent oxidoreductase
MSLVLSHSSQFVGDACVPPNPLAAYGATLACEAAGSLVQLAVGIGHVNSILADMKAMKEHVHDEKWLEQVAELKALLVLFYEARSRSENYFQWVQTLICNLYSLPSF